MESYKSKQEEREKITPVVTGSIEKKKKTAFSRFFHEFIRQDIADLKDYIYHDVLIPTGKDLILDIVNSILGTSAGTKYGRSSNVRAPHINYNKVSINDDRRVQPRERKQTYEYDTLTYYSRGDAEAVLASMKKMLNRYKFVRVRDLYELSNVSGDYTDNYYGWIDLSNARVERIRNGYAIKLPVAIPIDER